jgi:hypothetical protein
MFKDSDRNFMEKNMKILVDSIESELNKPYFSEFKDVATDSITCYISAIKEYEQSDDHRDLDCGQENDAEISIGSHFSKITKGMDEGDPVYQVLDALRYSFSGYAYNGLHQLYTRQENETWHPKIKLTEILEPNDIDLLPQNLILYRGCDICELESQTFGQAWTTSLEAATEFAFVHYASQDWFRKSTRIILEVNCSRDHILFSDQSCEFEVVVDVDKLRNVRPHGALNI